MLNKNVCRQALQDPLVSQALLGSQALRWVPLQALRYETHKRVIRNVSELNHDVFESLFLLLGIEDFKSGRGLGIFEL